MQEGTFLPIPVAALLDNTIPEFSLYLSTPNCSGQYALYRKAGLPITKERLARLKLNGVEHFYIEAVDLQRQHRYMIDTAKQLISDPGRSSAEKAAKIYAFSASAIQCALAEPSPESIRTCRELAHEHVRYIATDPHALLCLLQIVSHDYRTYTHSVNVCGFAVALCRRIGIDDMDELSVIGSGAMLHDIGKSRIDLAVLNKPGRLNPQERQEIEKHPELGIAVLAETQPLPSPAAEIVLGHHEKMDGSGYPRQLSAGQIAVPVRACSIADIFDALTSRRSYQHGLGGFRALQLMKQKMGTQLDREMLTEFIRLIGEASQA
jgi:putative nucleotidyltransferase with HDIG domain